MGKHERASSHVHASSSSIPLDERYRGRMWGLFHLLHYHQWRYIKRRLHHRKHGAERHFDGNPGSSAAAGRSDKLSNSANDREAISASNDSRKREHGTEASKNSMTGRIKSLILDDKIRHKGRHHRTSTAPAPLQSIQSNTDSLFAMPTTDVSSMTLRQRGSSKHSASKEAETLSTNRKASDGHIDQFRVDRHEKRLITQARNNEENLEPRVDLRGPDYQSGSSVNNRDVVEGINKELLLKFIRDAGAFSAQQRKEFSKRGILQRLGTFPFPGIQIGNVSEQSSPAHAKSEMLDSQERTLQDKNQAMSLAETESSGDVHRQTNLEEESGMSHHDTNRTTFAPVVVGINRNHGKNQAVSRHFKALKRKIKHAMRVNKKEKNRIAMDGILHRIPGDKEFSGELMEEMTRKWKDATVHRASPVGHEDNKHFATSAPRDMTRTPSLEASLHKYAQLFESSFSTEAKCQESSTFPASGRHTKLGRIASSPNMKLYSLSTENNSETRSVKKPSDVSENDDLVTAEDECSSLIPEANPENKPSLHTGEETIHDEQSDVIRHPPETDVGVEVPTTRENLNEKEIPGRPETDVGVEVFIARENLDENEIPGSRETDVGVVVSTPRENLDEMPVSPQHELFELPSAHGELSMEHEQSLVSSLFDIPKGYTASSAIDANLGYVEEQEISSKALEDMMDAQIHSKDREFFNYVRYVLEISGLSGKETLGLLHPNNQPLDRAVYAEVEDIWLHDPSIIKYDEGSVNYDHVLLFDLINEVLLEIYERSFTYYPKTLSPLCRIHRLPGGHRVLKEVWATISCYMSFDAGLDHTMDYATGKDLEKQVNWMNLQRDSEGVGIELEDLILDELLDEMIFE